MHRIKKYANRKMYDVKTKSYVTLEDIARLVEAGEEIIIIDNASGEEITQEIVSQLVGRVLDDQAKKLPMSVLVPLLRKGSGGLVDFSKKYVSFWQNALNLAEGELSKVEALIGRGKTDKSPSEEIQAKVPTAKQDELIRQLETRIEELLEQQIETDLAVKKQLSTLRADITKLTARMEMFENIFFQLMKIDKEKLPKA